MVETTTKSSQNHFKPNQTKITATTKKKKKPINPTKIKNKINFPETFTNKNTKHSNQSNHQKTQT